MLGEAITFTVSFNNTGDQTGYGPYIDLYLPMSGVDGSTPAPGNDGITINGATYLGVSVERTTLDCPAGGTVTHPLTELEITCPAAMASYTGSDPFIWELSVLRLPFGSFVADQPSVDVRISADLSNLADLSVAHTIQAGGGFQFGALATGGTPILQAGFTTAATSPTLIRLVKTYDGPEAETASGPNYPRHFTVSADIASNQTLSNFELLDNLPNNLAYLSFTDATAGYTLVDQPVTPGAQNVPDNDLLVRWTSRTGGTGTNDAFMTFQFYVPRDDADGNPVIDPLSGDDVPSINDALARGDWTPIDSRDSTTTVVSDLTSNDYTLTDKSIAIQKSAQNLSDASNSPEDVLLYTINFQVSDFFAFQNLVITDVISDGQRLDSSYIPTLAVNGNQFALAAAELDVANYDLDTSLIGNDDRSVDPLTDGSTTLTLRVSDELLTRGRPNGWMVGGCVPVDPAGDVGGTGGPAPDCSLYNDGAATATLTFRTIIQDYFSDDYTPPATASVDQGDQLNDTIRIAGDLLAVSDLAANGYAEDDNSSEMIEIARGSLDKSLYAINGATSFPSPLQIAPGDEVTYRIRYAMPTSDVERLYFTDYLPLPVFDATTVTALDDLRSATAPASGRAQFYTDDTFSGTAGISGIVPTISSSAAGNWVRFDYGDFKDPLNRASVVDILFTVTVRDDPFVDQLYLTNQARAHEGSTDQGDQDTDAIIQVQLTEPLLNIRKGVVWTDRSGATFDPATVGPGGVTFTGGGSTCPQFSGVISSDGLAANPVDSDLAGLDAGDRVTFAIIVENSGTGLNGAFDVTVRDELPSGMTVVGGPCVTDGSGAVIATQPGGDLFTTGLELVDPGPTATPTGALDAYDPSSGRNIAVITYDVTLDTAVNPRQTLTNTAYLTNYAGAEGGPDHTGTDLFDPASLSTGDPAAAKAIAGTELGRTASGQSQVVIGEWIEYRVTVTVPEGTLPSAQVIDTLDVGLALIGCTSISASPGVSTSLAGGLNDACQSGGSNPSYVNSTRVITFNLGTLTNSNTDNSVAETVTLVYRVIVDNVTTNTASTQRNNSAIFRWNGISLGAVSAPNVRILEPRLTTAKSATVNGGSFGDAGDPVVYTITLKHSTATYNTDAFDVTFADTLPRTGGGASLILAPGFTVSDTAGLVDDSFFEWSAGSSDANGWTLQTVSGTSFDMLYSTTRTITITVNGTLSAAAPTGQLVSNSATARWTSLDGDPGVRSSYGNNPTERTGTGASPNTYLSTATATFSVYSPGPVKSIVQTSEGHTSGTNLAIGEIVRYRIVARLPEGTSGAFTIQDVLGSGLQFLNDGTARVAFLSNLNCPTPSLSSSTLGTTPWQCGSDADVDSIVPSVALPDEAISSTLTGNTDTYNNGSAPYFQLGNLTNSDSDADEELLVVEFNALVLNVQANQAGSSLSNGCSIYVNGSTLSSGGSCSAVNLNVVESNLSLSKTLTTTPGDAGDGFVYSIVITNTATGANRAAAFEVSLDDVFPSYLDVQSFNFTLPVGSSLTSQTTVPGTAGELHFTVDVLPPAVDLTGVTALTVTVSGEVVDTAPAGQIISNAASIAYSSLPATGTGGNPTGSTTPGGSSATTGERDGSGAPLNDYTTTVNASFTLAGATIEKLAISPDRYTIGAPLSYFLRVTLPEGVYTNLVVRDALPDGLAYTGYQLITAQAASSGNLSADFSGTLAAETVDPASPPGASGADLSLTFATASVPADGDPANNRFLVRVDAQVVNVLVNQNNVVRPNQASVSYTNPNTGGTSSASSATVNITVIEPILALSKTIPTLPSPVDAGSLIPFQVTISHAAASASTAYDVRFVDTLPGGLLLEGPVVVSGATATDNSTGNTVDILIAQIPVGDSVTVTFSGRVTAAATPYQQISNQGNLTWSSLTGAASGERASGDGLLDAGGLNDYALQSSASFSIDAPTFSKAFLDTSAPSTSGQNVTIGEQVGYTLTISLPEGVTPALQVVDNLPAGLAFVAGSASLDTAAFAGSVSAPTVTTLGGSGDDVTFAFSNIVVTADDDSTNNSFVLSFDALVLDVPGNVGLSDPGQTSLPNSATLQMGSQPAVPGGTVTVTVVEPQLEIGKTFSPDEAADDDFVQVSLVLSNTGTSPAEDVVIDDPLPNARFDTFSEVSTPAGFTYTIVPSGADTIVRYSGGPLPAGASATFVFQMRIASLPDGQVYTNTATATQYSTLPGSASGERSEPPVSGDDNLSGIAPDIALSKASAVTATAPGNVIVYDLAVSNEGGRDASDVTVSETVPANTTYNATASAPWAWSCADGSPAGASCSLSLGDLAAGADQTVQFAVTVADPVSAAATSIDNTASASDDGSHGIDQTPGNNSDSESDPLGAAPDLSILKDDGGVTGAPGGTILYTLTYANNGDQAASGVTISETVPANTLYNAAASLPDVWSCADGSPAGTSCTLSVGTVAGGGAGGSVSFAVDVVDPLPVGVTQVANTAGVADDGANGADPTPADNTASDSTPLTAAPDLSILKDDGDVTGTPGGTILYTLAYANNGDQDASGVTISETVPANTTYNAVDSLPDVWSCADGSPAGTSCTLSVGALAGGGTGGSVSFAVDVVDPLPAGVTQVANTASVADDGANGADPTPADNTASDDTPLMAAPLIAALKAVTLIDANSNSLADPGETLEYTITIRNSGDQDAAGVVFRDTPDANTSLLVGSVTTTSGSVIRGNTPGDLAVEVDLGTLPGLTGAATVTFRVSIVDPVPAGVDQLENAGLLSGDNFTGLSTNTVSTPLNAAPDLAISKTDGVAQASEGAALTYQLTISNNGNQTATGVLVSDVIPLNTAFVSASDGGTYDNTTRTVTWPLFSLDPAAVVTRSVSVQVDAVVPPAVTTLVNNAAVQDDGSNGADPTPDDNTTSDTDGLGRAGKSLVETNLADTTGAQVAVGELLTYEVRLVITPGQTDNLLLVDTLEKGLAFAGCLSIGDPDGVLTAAPASFDAICQNPLVTAEPTGSSDAADAGRRLTLNFGTVSNPSGEEHSLVVRYRVAVLDNAANLRGTQLQNRATWTWNGGQVDLTASAVTVVEPALSLVKTVDQDLVTTGRSVTFELTVAHTAESDSPAYDVLLSDTLPGGLVYLPGSLRFVSGQAPDLLDDRSAPLLQVGWDVFRPDDSPTVLAFEAEVVLKAGQSALNGAELVWSSLPGGFETAQTPYNLLSTERFYQPDSTVNVYGADSSALVRVPELPATGFAPGQVTVIDGQPADRQYHAAGGLWLEIPSLGVELPVVGVPLVDGAWDLTWLGQQAGYLEGTAFPTWKGNSVITAHVYGADGRPGPFVSLKQLAYGDQIILHAYGQKQVFEVREATRTTPYDLSPLQHETLPWVTLITCQEYDPASGAYAWRVVVRAVLVDVKPDS